jgi:hypothetical protein
MKTSRREFVRLAMASGIALSVSRLAIAAEPGFAARETLPGRGGWNPAATGMGRVDGVAKVTGAKLYASDFRAADLPGWPSKTAYAMVLRAADATHVYAGIDLSALPGALQPSVVIKPPPISLEPAYGSPNIMPAICSARSARRRSISVSPWRC